MEMKTRMRMSEGKPQAHTSSRHNVFSTLTTCCPYKQAIFASTTPNLSCPVNSTVRIFYDPDPHRRYYWHPHTPAGIPVSNPKPQPPIQSESHKVFSDNTTDFTTQAATSEAVETCIDWWRTCQLPLGGIGPVLFTYGVSWQKGGHGEGTSTNGTQGWKALTSLFCADF